jgi:hypothetical protein
VAKYATMNFRDLIRRSIPGIPAHVYELKVDANKLSERNIHMQLRSIVGI